jgi:hypothetical protein
MWIGSYVDQERVQEVKLVNAVITIKALFSCDKEMTYVQSHSQE